MVTVLVGTAAGVFVTQPRIEAALASGAALALSDTGLGWARATITGRDATIAGIATDPAELSRAVAAVGAVAGIREVVPQTRLAPAASPYPFKAQRVDGALVLTGGIADERDRTDFASFAGAAGDRLELLSGGPEPDTWRAAVHFALAQAARLDQGEVALSDLQFSIAGRAASAADLDALAAALAAGLPAGLVAGRIEIAPPLAAPYLWSVEFDGRALSLSGGTPTAAARQLIAAAADGMQVTDRVRLASGAPPRFAEAAITLVDALTGLAHGRAEIRDTVITVSGQPETGAAARALAEAVAGLDGFDVRLALAPPLVPDPAAPYLWSASLADGGIAFEGHVPSDAARRFFAQRAGRVAVDRQVVTPGAPDGFALIALNGLDALARLQAGAVRFDGQRWMLTGHAASDAERAAALDAVAAEPLPSDGWAARITTAQAEPAEPPAAAPPADPFTWTATRTASGIELSGNVPTAAAKAVFALKTAAIDTQTVAAGAPDDFIAIATHGLDALNQLETGTVRFDGTSWSIAGQAKNRRVLALVNRILLRPQGPEFGWIAGITVREPELDLPGPSVAATAPVSPYLWAATKTEMGIELSGNVPAAAAKKVFAARSGAVDHQTVAAGAPDDFILIAMTGLNALHLLEIGNVRFDGTSWSIAGRAKNRHVRALVNRFLLGPHRPEFGWIAGITLPEPAPDPAPAPAPAPAAEPAPAPAPAPQAAPAPAPTPLPGPATAFAWSAVRDPGGSITLSGDVPTANMRGLLAIAAGRVRADTSSPTPGGPSDFLRVAVLGLAALSELETGRFAYDGTDWLFTGNAADEPARRRALSRLASAPGSAAFRVLVQAPPAIDWCRAQVAEFTGGHTILFAPASDRIAEASLPGLAELADVFAQCPNAEIHVEGHTDADGPDDYNLALSLGRAEAVVDRLIELGVNNARLYAVGYGESLPIAANDTVAGKTANRRIVFTLVEPGG